jgi:hypothetical protein
MNGDISIPDHSPNPRTFRIEGKNYPVVPLPVPAHWRSIALQKGYDLVARIGDHHHLALRCHSCGGLNRVKVFTLRSAQPNCLHCQDARWREIAEAAGAHFVRRCPHSHRYAWLRLPCGHEVRRQMGMVRKVARGEVAFRCNTCHSTREKREAQGRDWTLIGPDPKGNPNYRLYTHTCGHQQRVARANMQSGRFGCAGCGEGWTTAPSGLYLMRFTLPNSRVLIKLGMSRDVDSRLNHQLLRHDEVQAEILDHLPMATGQRALKLEKGLHAMLRRRGPQHVVPRAAFERHLKVRSEIYEPVLEPFLRNAFQLARQRGVA